MEGIHLYSKDILKTTGRIAIAGALLQLSGAAFSRPARREIWRRAVNSSEVSHRNDRPLECSHINHSRDFQTRDRQGKRVEYSSPSNGILCTDEEHLLFHEDFCGTSHIIGLDEEKNIWAIDSLNRRIEEFNQARGIDPLTEVQREIYTDAIRYKVQEHCRREGLPDPYKLRDSYLQSLKGFQR